MHAKRPTALAGLSLGILVLVLTACDGYADTEIRNTTDMHLRVEIDDDDGLRSSQTLPPGRAIAFEAILGGVSTKDLGQLRAFAPDGSLVFERDLTLDNGDQGCRIELTESIQPEARVECVEPANGIDRHAWTYSVIVRTNSEEVLDLYRGGEWLGHVTLATPVEIEVSRDRGAVRLVAVEESGARRFERVLYPSDVLEPQEIMIP